MYLRGTGIFSCKKGFKNTFAILLSLLLLAALCGCAPYISVRHENIENFIPGGKVYLFLPTDPAMVTPKIEKVFSQHSVALTASKLDASYELRVSYQTGRSHIDEIVYLSMDLCDLYDGRVIYSVRSRPNSWRSKKVIVKLVTDMLVTLTESKEKAAKIPAGEIKAVKEEELKKYYDENSEDLDKIEGIWVDLRGNHRIGIKKDPSTGLLVATVISSIKAGWKNGDIKAEFEVSNSPGIYATKYFLPDKRATNTTSMTTGNGVLEIPAVTASGQDYSMTLHKVYPVRDRFRRMGEKGTVDDAPVPSAPSKYDDFMDAVVAVRSRFGLGTGFFLTREGLLVTNEHVISTDKTVSLKLRDGRVLIGEVLSKDMDADLALIRAPKGAYPWLTLADPVEGTEGTEVIAIGTPAFLGWSFSRGILSGQRISEGINYLQTDTTINPGNSGGPLIVEATGKVLGVNTLSMSRYDGLNFAVSSREIERLFGAALRAP
ncbi:serine protease [bacterium]|nr:MAG: serine protease [bacterium]